MKFVPNRRVALRVVMYGTLLAALPAAYVVSNYGVIPGYDPNFQKRETDNIKIIEEDGKTLLWGGENPEEHFDITEFRLEPSHLEYGLGRERFPALVRPEFQPAHEATLPDNARVLVAKSDDEVKVYPISLMRKYEAVNDALGDRPILAAYCVLADLGAVYDRRVGDTTYTFGVSGYTYYDAFTWSGRSAFVLWDRETESLWWPPIGKAVSGPSIDVPMRVLDHELWAQTTWGEVKDRYSNALVLTGGAAVENPAAWPRTSPPGVPRAKRGAPKSAIAPRWGENTRLDTREN